MFDRYSERSRQAIFLARVMAGRRGAPMLDVDDLICALLLEDQDKVVETLSNLAEFTHLGQRIKIASSHPRFFDAHQASELLDRIEDSLTRSQPVPPDADMPFSDSAKRALNAASALVEPEAQVEPLHLLAAAVEEQESNAAHLLREVGVTKQRALSALQDEGS